MWAMADMADSSDVAQGQLSEGRWPGVGTGGTPAGIYSICHCDSE